MTQGSSQVRNSSGHEDRLNLGGDLRGVLVQHEVTGIEPDQFGVGQVIQIRTSARRNEERVVLALDDQRLWTVRAEGRLPLGIEGDIGLVVLK